MTRAVLAVVLCLLMAFVFGCSEDQDDGDEQPVADADGVYGEGETIELQASDVIVPPGHVGEGGYIGYRYYDAVITPAGGDLDYEIVVRFGMTWTTTPFDSILQLRARDLDGPIVQIETDGWASEDVLAYTGVFTKDGVATQVVGVYRDTGYTEAYMTVRGEQVSEHTDVLIDFMKKYFIATWEGE